MQRLLKKKRRNDSSGPLEQTMRDDEIETSSLGQELRDFFAESKKCQILYSNCEGAYPRRVFSTKDRTSLADFVLCTLYFKDSPDWKITLESSERGLVEQILDKMICLSQDYKFIEEVHLSVVWIYYFDFQLKTQNATPLFKIFKKKSGDEAVFMDVFLTLHESWDYYLDNAALPWSFLCVPRNGVYSFVGEMNELDLEFVIVKGILTNTKSLKKTSFMPFSQVAIRPWLVEISFWSAEKLQQVKYLLSEFFCRFGKVKITFLHVIVLICHVGSKIEEFKNQPLLTTLSSFSEHCLMLLNTTNSNSIDISKQMTGCLSDENLSVSFKEVENFGELLKTPQKDWKKILESFFCLYRNFRFLLQKIPIYNPLLKILFVLLNLGEELTRNFEKKKEANRISSHQENGNSKSNNLMVSPKSPTPTSSVVANPQPQQLCLATAVGTVENLNSQAVNDFVSCESFEFLTNLTLEKTSVNKIRDQLPKKSEKFEGADCTIFVAEKNGLGIFYFCNASLPQLSQEVRRLIGIDFSLSCRETWYYEIINPSKQIIGYIYFVGELVAVGLFYLEYVSISTMNMKRLI